MKKHLWLLGISLALSGGGLAWVLAARDDEPPANPAKDEAPPKLATSKITQVTVYPNSALVTREVDVPAGAGSIELVVNPLPQHTINSSLYSEGSEGIRVMTTRFRTRPVKEDTRDEVRKLEEDAKKRQLDQLAFQADLEAIKQNMVLLSKLEAFTQASTQHATTNGKLDSKEIITLTQHVMDGRTEKTKELVKLQAKIQENQEHLEFTARKLQEMTAGSSKTERDAVIVVEKANNAPGKVRLNYLVDRAAWRPQYKLRAGKTTKDAVQVEYLAAIVQQTGEDWQSVNLILSTAQPRLNAAPPDLKMLAVNVVTRGTQVATNPMIPNPPGQQMQLMNQPQGGLQLQGQFQGQFQGFQGAQIMGAQPGVSNTFSLPNPVGNTTELQLNETARQLRFEAQKEQNLNKNAESNEIFNYAGALEQARDLVLAAEETKKGGKPVQARAPKNEGPSVTYHLNARLTVPSRNDEQVLEVARLDMAPEYFYKAVPVLTTLVYRQANLTNKSKYILLPGEGTMYDGTDFVGRMNIPLVAIGEQFTVGFGADPQLQVQRQMTEKTRAMQGANQILKYEYRIRVSSFKPEQVKVQLWDRLPMAEGETMAVTLVKTTPELSKEAMYVSEDRPHNLLRWDLDIDPEMNGEKANPVNYEFKLELAQTMHIGSFMSK